MERPHQKWWGFLFAKDALIWWIMTGPISPVIISRRAPDSKKNKNNFWWNENCFLTLVKQKQTLWTIKL